MSEKQSKLMREQKRFIELTKGYGYLKAFALRHGYNYNTLRNLRSVKYNLPFSIEKIQEMNNKIIAEKKNASDDMYMKLKQISIFDFCENPNSN